MIVKSINMKLILKFVFILNAYFFISLISIENAEAGCVCKCVNGSVQAICSSTLDLRPLCPPKICPLMAPKLQPLQPLTLPPLGTTSCQLKQVYNSWTGQYEWQNLCQ